MDERLREVLGDEDAWIVGGAVATSCSSGPFSTSTSPAPSPAMPRTGSRAASAASSFPLSEKHGAWRVVADGVDETVDFTPVGDGIDADLATRDFTFNAIAVHVADGETHDPHDGRADLEAGSSGLSRSRSSSTTRCGSFARCASRTSSGSGWTSAPRLFCARRRRS